MPSTKTTKTTKTKLSPDERITALILDQLANGVVPWRAPFVPGASLPRNVVTGTPYRGINRLLLGMFDMGSPFWATRRQLIKAGATVPKNLPDLPIVVFRPYEKTLKANEQPRDGERVKVDDKGRRYVERLTVKNYWVVNAALVDGIELPVVEPNVSTEPLTEFEAMLDGYENKPRLVTDEMRASYSPGADVVAMPPRASFVSDAAYVHTYLHELVHSTGHKDRLNRDMAGAFGSKEYAREELIAEIGSCFLMHDLQLDPEIDQSAAYIDNWRQRLTDDPRLIIRAAQAATKAASHINPERDAD